MFGVKESLLAEFKRVEDAGRAADYGFRDGWFWEIEADFVLAGARD